MPSKVQAVSAAAESGVSMANQCICAVGDHGHEPGKCQSEATEAHNLCADCHAKAKDALETQKVFPDESF